MSLFLLAMVLNWAVPFLALLSQWAKKDPVRMAQVSVVILVGLSKDEAGGQGKDRPLFGEQGLIPKSCWHDTGIGL